jgi:hypothetical protein
VEPIEGLSAPEGPCKLEDKKEGFELPLNLLAADTLRLLSGRVIPVFG